MRQLENILSQNFCVEDYDEFSSEPRRIFLSDLYSGEWLDLIVSLCRRYFGQHRNYDEGLVYDDGLYYIPDQGIFVYFITDYEEE